MKKFLYLVQTRIAHLNQYPDLVSSDADVIYLTFEEKVDKPNYIYAPNTDWAEGRNYLIEAAKKCGHYQYYILLDDDLEFVIGSFRLFEKELLAVQPDFAVPIYRNKDIIRSYERIIRPMIKHHLFRYSNLVSFDSAFICLSHALFYDNRLLPYNMHYHNKFRNSACGSRMFWLNLFEYYSQHKLYMINRVTVRNTEHLVRYNKNYHYNKLKQLIKQDNPNYQFLLEKQVPALLIQNRLPIIVKNRLRYQFYRHKNKAPRLFFILRSSTRAVFCTFFYGYVYTLALYKDIKLALAMRWQRL